MRQAGRRLLLPLPALLLPRTALAEGRVFRPAPGGLRGPEAAAGALVWAHAHYAEGAPPDPPPCLDRLTGWDRWRLDREGARDPLEAGAAALIAGCARLRAAGYGQVAVVGESRGAFVALLALRQPGLAEAMLLLAPAAHGTRPERRAEALAAFEAACAAAAPGAVRRGGLVLFAGDPYDPDPAARATAFTAGMARAGAGCLVIDRPPEPTGHGAARDAAFDARFGARLAAFLGGPG
ncbi:hypothetical protein ACFQS7_12825 [Dankookia sp. GCM10030260]|uniref:hypothetical protein n=1 Tax=Dankookia sp. GCM10030260 TaxID=3273390 RepID=UPI00360ED549